MKKIIFALFIMPIVTAQEVDKNFTSNPFFTTYNTPFEVPPFSIIKAEHFKPAILEGIKKQEEEIATICSLKEPATFLNTIVALEKSGRLLSKVSTVFYNLNGTDTNPEFEKIAQEIAPFISAHQDEIYMNETLFSRVKTVYNQKTALKLNTEQNQLLENTYKAFIRSGANLNKTQKERLKNINAELATLTLKFGQNVLHETNSFELIVDDENRLYGLSEDQLTEAKQEATKRGYKNNFAFTLSNASALPFLSYCQDRGLRENMWYAYVNRANNGNDKDNNSIIRQMVNLRLEKAKLLGYKNHAAYVLEKSMAKTPEKVMEFLLKLWKPALEKAKAEETEIKSMMENQGISGEVYPYDWRYYSEKLRKAKFDLDEQELRPYFSINNVQQGVFLVTKKLFGLEFKERKDLPKYNAENSTWEVLDANGNFIGILYMDFHPRSSKRGGAWMTSFRNQEIENGTRITPIVSIVCNFTKPTATAPALLTFDEVITYFHEFGHALHGLLSQVTYKSLSGTNVPRDFVELPSQIMENWAADPEVLKLYAKHYKTGEVIPDALIKKLENAGTFGQGFATVEYLASALLDMEYHTLEEPMTETAEDFENKAMKKYGLLNAIVPRHRSSYFSHIFAGGYSAGYYSYIWSGVLDTDAFEQFKKASLFDAEKAASFKKNILEKGGTEEPMELYKKFRGSEPSIEPLLKKRGLQLEPSK